MPTSAWSPAETSGRTAPAASGIAPDQTTPPSVIPRSSGWRFSRTNGPMKSCGSPFASHAAGARPNPTRHTPGDCARSSCRRLGEHQMAGFGVRHAGNRFERLDQRLDGLGRPASRLSTPTIRGRGSASITSLSRASASSESRDPHRRQTGRQWKRERGDSRRHLQRPWSARPCRPPTPSRAGGPASRNSSRASATPCPGPPPE